MKPSWPLMLLLGFGSGVLLEITLRLPTTNILAPLVLVPLLWVLARGNPAQTGVAMLLFGLPSGFWVHEGGFLLYPFWTAVGLFVYMLAYGLVGFWTALVRQHLGRWAAWLALLSGWAGIMFVLMQPNITERFAHLAWVAMAVALLDTPLLSAAAWSGITGLGLLLWLLNLGLYELLLERRWVPLAVVTLFAALAVTLAPSTQSTARASQFTVVQTNARYVEEELAPYNPALTERLLQPLARQSQRPEGVLLWPEGSVPMPIRFGQAPPPQLLKALAHADEALIGGIGLGANSQVYNTVFGWRGGRLEPVYNKQVLMPGGEDNLIPGAPDQPLYKAGGLELGLLICYESIIPWVARRSVEQGAEALVVLTSNSFAGGTDTPLAHLAGSRILAASLGRPLVFAAKTGPSVFTDARGRVLTESKRGTVTTLVGRLEGHTGLTPYARVGDWLGGLGLLVVLGQMLVVRLKLKLGA